MSLRRSEESAEFSAIYSKAVSLLSKRDLFEAEVRLKLAAFPGALVDQVMARLKGQHIVNDRSLVLRLIEANQGPRAISNLALRAKCELRGASADALRRFDGIEDGSLRPLLARFEPVPENVGRAARFLVSRGFDQDAVEAALERHFGTIT
jgi:SOS response regulatory protein OraA/RecX